MNCEKLLAEGKIEPVEKSRIDFSLAERDMKAAKDNLNLQNYDWALSIAYNAVLQAGRMLVQNLGYRAKGKDQHKIVFEFLNLTDLNKNHLFYFDKVRKMRHAAVYDQTDIVSKSAAEEAIQKAADFVQEIRTSVPKNRTQR